MSLLHEDVAHLLGHSFGEVLQNGVSVCVDVPRGDNEDDDGDNGEESLKKSANRSPIVAPIHVLHVEQDQFQKFLGAFICETGHGHR